MGSVWFLHVPLFIDLIELKWDYIFNTVCQAPFSLTQQWEKNYINWQAGAKIHVEMQRPRRARIYFENGEQA